MANKLRVGVAFGFRSPEHEVSVITGQQVIAALDTSRFDVIPIYVTKQGHWYTGEALLTIAPFRNGTLDLTRLTRVFLPPDPSVRALVALERPRLFGQAKTIPLDVVFPCAHGSFGEDGCLQGLLELADLPYVGAGVLGSSVGMDKLVMKSVFRQAGLPVLPFVGFTRIRWQQQQDAVLADIERGCGWPVVVKPACCGSSIAVSLAADSAAAARAIDEACLFDRRVIVERAIVDLIELNCSVMGFQDEAQTSMLEQPVRKGDLLTFKDKYGDGSQALTGAKESKTAGACVKGAKSAGMASAQRLIPAPVADDMAAQVRAAALTAFRACDAAGVCRIDFLLDRSDGRLYINEINTIPGSMAFYLWGREFDFVQLAAHLVDLALQAHREKRRSIYALDTALLTGAR